MVNYTTIMQAGICIECGAKETNGLSCDELFGFPLVWEHNDPKLYALHFWLVACYMIQHPSTYTEEGYKHLVTLFTDAYDNNWDTTYILKKNRELVKNVNKITNPLSPKDRKRKLKSWSITIEDIYVGGEEHAIENIQKWKDCIRKELSAT